MHSLNNAYVLNLLQRYLEADSTYRELILSIRSVTIVRRRRANLVPTRCAVELIGAPIPTWAKAYIICRGLGWRFSIDAYCVFQATSPAPQSNAGRLMLIHGMQEA